MERWARDRAHIMMAGLPCGVKTPAVQELVVVVEEPPVAQQDGGDGAQRRRRGDQEHDHDLVLHRLDGAGAGED